MSTQQSEALYLAHELEIGCFSPNVVQNEQGLRTKSAAELRRLHARVQELEAQQERKAPTKEELSDYLMQQDAVIVARETYEGMLTAAGHPAA